MVVGCLVGVREYTEFLKDVHTKLAASTPDQIQQGLLNLGSVFQTWLG